MDGVNPVQNPEISIDPLDHPDFMRVRPSFLRKTKSLPWIDPEDLFPMYLVREMENPGRGASKLNTFLCRVWNQNQTNTRAKVLLASNPTKYV